MAPAKTSANSAKPTITASQSSFTLADATDGERRKHRLRSARAQFDARVADDESRPDAQVGAALGR
jgi:hypothetical protein